jgi:esterase/lipase
LKLVHLFLATIIIAMLFTGCSNGQTSKVNETKVQSPQSNDLQNKNIGKKDGQVISMTKIKDSDLDPSLEAFRMMYWSDGIKAEAYVAAPIESGTYSLFVQCHGGWTIPRNKSHLLDVPGVHFDVKGIIGNAPNYFITIAPMYRGYGNSDGKVKGIFENTIDSENAINAVMNYFNSLKETRHIQHQIYLSGISMGGTVVLKLAAEREDIQTVVAVSPFVGWNIFDEFAIKHMDDEYVAGFFKAGEDAYGSFDPDSQEYRDQSIPFEKIKAPTLLIQGTNDQTIPWGTVQALYDKMKENRQDVAFNLVEGGDHALTNKQGVLAQIMTEWYAKHWHWCLAPPDICLNL